MASQNVLEFNDANFAQEVLQSDVPVLVDFWAEWCGPCRMLAPTVEAIADEYAGRVKVGKFDIDKSQEMAMRFGIQSIPTIIVFKGGQMIKKIVGLQNKKALAGFLDEALG